MKKLVMTGGGTAGHCKPNLALIPQLSPYFKIDYIGSVSGVEKQLAESYPLPYYSIPCTKLRRNLSLKNLLIPYVLVKSIFKSKKILKEISPDVVFSKGGYVALPVVIAAHSLSIPIIIHESDLSVGLTNKICAKYAEYVLTSFEKTAKQFTNGIYTGSPIDEKLFSGNKAAFLKECSFPENKPVLSVFGGSLGSKTVNAMIRDSLPALLKKYNVVHICGKNNKVTTKFKGYRQIEFSDNLADVYAATDIAVTRGGANTLNELFALHIPSLVIPLSKKASRGDQIENAIYYANKGIFPMIREEDCNKKALCDGIDELYLKRNRYIDVMKAKEIKNSNKKIVDVIKSVL